jgi:hypothetical protein
MDTLKKLINTFAYVIAGTTLCTALFITIFVPGLALHISLLWEMIAVSAVCSLGNFIYYYKKVLSKRQMRFRIICHYLYINAVVMGSGYLFEWMTPGLIIEFLVMLLLIAVVYVIIAMVTFRQEAKVADILNRQLRKQFPQQEEEEE